MIGLKSNLEKMIGLKLRLVWGLAAGPRFSVSAVFVWNIPSELSIK